MDNKTKNLKAYKAGEIIAKEGDESNDIFLLMEGKIGIYKHDIEIAKYDEQGFIFGEMGAILGGARTATVKALEPTKVVVVSGKIDNMIEEHPHIIQKIIINLARNLKNITNNYCLLANVDEETEEKK